MFAHCLKYLFATSLLLVSSVLISDCSARELSIHEFDTLVNDRKYLFIFFYSENCEDCSKLWFTWNLLEKRILTFVDSKLIIGQINCDIHKELCAREAVQKVPTIKLFTALGGNTQLEYVYDHVETDLASLENFLRKKLANSVIEGSHAYDIKESTTKENGGIKLNKKGKIVQWVIKDFYELSDEDFLPFLTAKGENLVYFYTPWCQVCNKLSPKWESLIKSLELRVVRLSRINCAQSPYACKFYLVKDIPTLLWISDGHIKQRYKNLANEFNVDQLVRIIEQAKDLDKLQNNLNTEDFRPFIDSGYHFVRFTVPWSKHCEQMDFEWLKLLEKAAKINVKLSKVDCSVNEVLCEVEQIDGYPTLYLYKNGQRLGEYEGTRNVNSFFEYLQQFILPSEHNEL